MYCRALRFALFPKSAIRAGEAYLEILRTTPFKNGSVEDMRADLLPTVQTIVEEAKNADGPLSRLLIWHSLKSSLRGGGGWVGVLNAHLSPHRKAEIGYDPRLIEAEGDFVRYFPL